jgi:hypothetical protein
MVAAHARRPGLRPDVLRRPARRQRSQGERAALTVVAIQNQGILEDFGGTARFGENAVL